MNADSEISHVTDGRVCLQLMFIKPSSGISPELFDVTNKHAVACTRVYTVYLHMEQAFEILLEEMKGDTDVLEETFRFITRIKYWSSFEHTVAFANHEYNHAVLCYSCGSL